MRIYIDQTIKQDNSTAGKLDASEEMEPVRRRWARYTMGREETTISVVNMQCNLE